MYLLRDLFYHFYFDLKYHQFNVFFFLFNFVYWLGIFPFLFGLFTGIQRGFNMFLIALTGYSCSICFWFLLDLWREFKKVDISIAFDPHPIVKPLSKILSELLQIFVFLIVPLSILYPKLIFLFIFSTFSAIPFGIYFASLSLIFRGKDLKAVTRVLDELIHLLIPPTFSISFFLSKNFLVFFPPSFILECFRTNDLTIGNIFIAFLFTIFHYFLSLKVFEKLYLRARKYGILLLH